jgi:hypothetical protein
MRPSTWRHRSDALPCPKLSVHGLHLVAPPSDAFAKSKARPPFRRPADRVSYNSQIPVCRLPYLSVLTASQVVGLGYTRRSSLAEAGVDYTG